MERHYRIVGDDWLSLISSSVGGDHGRYMREVANKLQVEYSSQSEAEAEAEALANANKGLRFTVLEAVCSYVAKAAREAPEDLEALAREKREQLRGDQS